MIDIDNKEILAKTIVAKAKSKCIKNYNCVIENVDKILGCIISNHHFEIENKVDDINIKGSFDVQVWYKLNNNLQTNVKTLNLKYLHVFKMEKIDENCDYQKVSTIVDCDDPICIKINTNVDIDVLINFYAYSYQQIRLNVMLYEDEIEKSIDPQYLKAKD